MSDKMERFGEDLNGAMADESAECNGEGFIECFCAGDFCACELDGAACGGCEACQPGNPDYRPSAYACEHYPDGGGA